MDKIKSIYHNKNGILGYRSMRIYLEREGIKYSATTIHKYMNKELGLHSIARKSKPKYIKGKSHKVFLNLIDRDFHADAPNKKWLTDFTYLNLTDGNKRYNCTIIDLYDRSVVASVTDKNITTELAIKTLGEALKKIPKKTSGIILHSDQGTQFTSKEFIEFCEKVNVIQSMSKAGCPYDNAPMERYFNTLKNELTNHHYYHNDKELYTAISEFAYITYNHVRPHSYNGYKTPFEARNTS